MELVGERIGNYCVTALIKKGGMGAVYMAEHPEIGRKVAIKVMFRTLDARSRDAERFLFEARAAANIDHPNVIDIYDFGRLDDGRPYLVMELLQGRELADVIHQRGKMPAAEVLPYLRQICAGLQAAHNAGIVHRDLKPENVFVLDRQPLAVRVLDFGIAKTQTWPGASLTGTGKIVGTPLVIAPEQASCESAAISPRTDLYSLGVILYWMLAGKPPFSRDAPVVLVARHILTPPPPLQEVEPSVPPGVADLVNQCLEKLPERRPATASEVAARFARALGEETGEHELEVVPWEQVRCVELRGSPTPREMGLSTSASTGLRSVDRQTAVLEEARPRTGTDLDVPGLEPVFEQPPPEEAPAHLPTPTEMETRDTSSPGRRGLVAAALVLLAVGAGLYARSAMRRSTTPSPQGADLAQAATSLPDQQVAPDTMAPRPADSRPTPRGPDARTKKPRPAADRRPRKPPNKLRKCPESRVGESTMDPFGTRCRKK